MVAVRLQRLPTVLVVVNRSLLVLIVTLAIAVFVNQGLGNICFGAKIFMICGGGAQRAAGGAAVEVDVHVTGNTRARSIFCFISRAIGANDRRGLFVSHSQLL